MCMMLEGIAWSQSVWRVAAAAAGGDTAVIQLWWWWWCAEESLNAFSSVYRNSDFLSKSVRDSVVIIQAAEAEAAKAAGRRQLSMGIRWHRRTGACPLISRPSSHWLRVVTSCMLYSVAVTRVVMPSTSYRRRRRATLFVHFLLHMLCTLNFTSTFGSWKSCIIMIRPECNKSCFKCTRRTLSSYNPVWQTIWCVNNTASKAIFTQVILLIVVISNHGAFLYIILTLLVSSSLYIIQRTFYTLRRFFITVRSSRDADKYHVF